MIGVFQGLRFVAILIVILNHVREFRWWTFNWYGCGMWALMLFFALSGFLSGYRDRGRMFSARGIVVGLGRRMLHLYPLYFLALITGTRFLGGVIALLRGSNPVGSIWDGWPFAHFLLMQSWLPWTYEYFLPLGWFLSTILFLYLVGDVLLPFLRKLNVKGLVSVAVGCICVSVGFSAIVWRAGVPLRMWTQIFPPARVPEYVAMMAVGLLCARRKIYIPSPSGILGVTLVEVGAVALLGCAAAVPWDWTSVGVRWILPNLILILSLLPGRGFVSRLLGCRLLVTLGGLTLPVYLFHNHVLKAVALAMKRMGLAIETLQMKIFGFAVSLVLVYLLAGCCLVLMRRLRGKERL